MNGFWSVINLIVVKNRLEAGVPIGVVNGFWSAIILIVVKNRLEAGGPID